MRFISDRLRWIGLMIPLALPACATRDVLPKGDRAYSVVPATDLSTSEQSYEYRIGPLDILAISVFGEPDLSFKEISVDANGRVHFPLVGAVYAAGHTTSEVSEEIAARLREKYLVDPQVFVSVEKSVGQQVAVEGDVNDPGIFPIQGQMTLLRVLALAKSTNKVASTDEVIVFRTIDGQRKGAIFDINRIRKGVDPDPRILGNDIVVVGFNSVKGAYRDFLNLGPILNAFRGW